MMEQEAHSHQPEETGPEPAPIGTKNTSPESWQVSAVYEDAPDARKRLSRAIGIILAAAGRSSN
jgi:hypothetical protein